MAPCRGRGLLPKIYMQMRVLKSSAVREHQSCHFMWVRKSYLCFGAYVGIVRIERVLEWFLPIKGIEQLLCYMIYAILWAF